VGSQLTSDLLGKPKATKAPEKAEKKTRKKREPDAPKKPMSAFFWYQQARRADLKKEKPELGHKEVIVVSSQLINPLDSTKTHQFTGFIAPMLPSVTSQ
jgi:hypothetical protein